MALYRLLSKTYLYFVIVTHFNMLKQGLSSSFFFVSVFSNKGLHHLEKRDLTNLFSWVIPLHLASMFHVRLTLESHTRVPSLGLTLRFPPYSPPQSLTLGSPLTLIWVGGGNFTTLSSLSVFP